MDLLGPEIFSTLWMKGQVLHCERAHLKVTGWSLVWYELLTKKLLIIFLSRSNEITSLAPNRAHLRTNMNNLVPNIVNIGCKNPNWLEAGCSWPYTKDSQGAELKEPLKNNPVSGRVEGLFPGPPDYKPGVLTTWPPCLHNTWWKISGMIKKMPLLSFPFPL